MPQWTWAGIFIWNWKGERRKPYAIKCIAIKSITYFSTCITSKLCAFLPYCIFVYRKPGTKLESVDLYGAHIEGHEKIKQKECLFQKKVIYIQIVLVSSKS